jgi:hypothetical protein
MKIQIEKLLKQLLRNSFSSRKFFLFFSYLVFFLVVLGYSLTVPLRGQISFGANYLSDDGVVYAKNALILSGMSELSACEIVQEKWQKLGNYNVEPCKKDQQNQLIEQFYKPRYIYPFLISVTAPFLGINSIFITSIILFFILFSLQIRISALLNSFNFRLNLLSSIILLTNVYFIKLNLSSTGTDVILSLLIIFLFYGVITNISSINIILLSVILSIISTFNKQTQIFWIIFSLTVLISLIFQKTKAKKKLIISSFVILITQVISIVYTELNWESVKVARSIGFYPHLLSGSPTDFISNTYTALSRIVINDTATILTKNFSNLITFISLPALYIFSRINLVFTSKEKENINLVLIFANATLVACVSNAYISGYGNSNLRFYLPFIVFSFFSVVLSLQGFFRLNKTL